MKKNERIIQYYLNNIEYYYKEAFILLGSEFEIVEVLKQTSVILKEKNKKIKDEKDIKFFIEKKLLKCCKDIEKGMLSHDIEVDNTKDASLMQYEYYYGEVKCKNIHMIKLKTFLGYTNKHIAKLYNMPELIIKSILNNCENKLSEENKKDKIELEETILSNLDDLSAPKGIEKEIRKTYNNDIPSVKIYKKPIVAAILIILTIMFMANFNKIIPTNNYEDYEKYVTDNVINPRFADIITKNMGQAVHKKETLENGDELYIDRIVIDNMRMVVFYRYRYSNEESPSLFYSSSFSDLLLKSEEDEIRSSEILQGQPINYVKKNGEQFYGFFGVKAFNIPENMRGLLNFNFIVFTEGRSEAIDKDIRVKLNKNKAFVSSKTYKINKSIEVDGIVYDFKELTYSPINTFVKGTTEIGDENLKEKLNLNKCDVSLIFSIFTDSNYETGANYLYHLNYSNNKLTFEEYIYDVIEPPNKYINIWPRELEISENININIPINNNTKELVIDKDTESIILKEVNITESATILTYKIKAGDALNIKRNFWSEIVEENGNTYGPKNVDVETVLEDGIHYRIKTDIYPVGLNDNTELTLKISRIINSKSIDDSKQIEVLISELD